MAQKFSTAMCTYNGARYLREQLESIAAQERPPDELVVCDDRSSDETCRIVESFAATAPFPVRLSVNEKNLGSTKNFEKATRLCEGDLIALSDQDDVWMPAKLRRIEDRFAAEPGAGLVFTDAEVVDEHLRPLGYRLWDGVGFDGERRRLVRGGRALDVLLPGWTVTGATMAFRASFRGLVLDFPHDLPLIHDGWIALLIAAVAEVSFVDEPLVKYRQHARQQVGAPEKKGEAGDHAQPGFADLRAAMQRANSYDELIEIGERASARLAARRGAYDCGGALAKLDARLTHLRARASLPAGKIGRLAPVFRELLSRRYHLYSNGIHSAAKDLWM